MYNKKDVSRQIYRMLIPMILENVLTTSASLVTTAMVGRLTALEISAQGEGGRITNTYLSLFKGLAVGVTVVAALSGKGGVTNAAVPWSRLSRPRFRWAWSSPG